MCFESFQARENIDLTFTANEIEGISKNKAIVFLSDRDSLKEYAAQFNALTPKYSLVPYGREFIRKTKNKVLVDDKFVKQIKNADYSKNIDEPFSEDHLFYAEEDFIGISDYSVVGFEYSESGFSPHAVAIHIVYFDTDMSLRIRHFVSESNDDVIQPSKKIL